MIDIIKKEDLATKAWSGGTTTQLYIYPKDASYEKKDFIFRISTATVDVEESTFTKLEGVSRCIMVLDGEMKLTHKDHHTIVLKKYDTDSFSGDWETKSFGKVTDFNLMTTEGRWGYIGSSTLTKGENFLTEQIKDIMAISLYIVKGSIEIKTSSQDLSLNKGDIAVCNNKDLCSFNSIKIVATEDTEIAIAIIKE